MSFLAWTFLFGAAALVGPIAAHLLAKPRFRRVPFTMLRFLRSGQRQSHSRRRLRDLMVLLLRCAIIALIAILFAQPILSVKSKPQEHRNIHFLAVDNSMSMAYQDNGRALLDRMKDKALDLVRQSSTGDTFNIYALASGQTATDLTRDQAITEIRQLPAVPKNARLDDFFSALRQVGKTTSVDETISALVLSDFSPEFFGAFEQIHEPVRVDDLQCEPILATEPINNAAVIGARLIGRDETELSLDVTVANYGAARQRTLTAQTAGVKPVSMELSLKAHQSDVVRMEIDLRPESHGTGQVYWPIELGLSPGDNLAADDTYRVAAYIPPSTSVNVLLICRNEDTFLFETAIAALSDRRHAGRLDLKRVAEDRLMTTDLKWADIAVFPSLPSAATCHPRNLRAVADRGGRLIFFLTDVSHSPIAEQLWNEQLLPAFPDRWIEGITYPSSGPVTGPDLDFDDRVARSLANYHLERIAVKGHWRCDMSPEAQCVWQLADGAGLLYGQAVGGGSSILVNTSINDSLGLLAKSRAWPAFCQYLLGAADRMQEFAFSTNDRPILHLPEAARDSRPYATIQVENSDDSSATARAEGTILRLPGPAGTGWMKTLTDPPLYAGINLPAGETDMTPPASEAVAKAVQRVVLTDRDEDETIAQAETSLRPKPIWDLCAWAAILLLLFESALANRLKR